MLQKIKREFKEFRLLLRNVPVTLTLLFVVALLAMNLLANKSISLSVDWLALDCGIIVSWVAFLAMDVLTKHFGPKAATEISMFALAFNLLFCLIFFVASKIGGVWGESFVEGSEGIIGRALDNTFGGSWFVLVGSTVAFVASAFINNFTNWGVGKLFRKNPHGAGAYFVRTYVSTAIGQFADNLIFALIVSLTFFNWSITQCLTCAATGMVVELVCEAAFSYFGFRLCEKWRKDGLGAEYLAAIAQKGEEI